LPLETPPTRYTKLFITGWAVILAACCLIALEHVVKRLEARSIVRAMNRVYSNCRTYSDSGICVNGKDKIRFETRFKRPGSLIFQCITNGDPKTLEAYWTQGVSKRFWIGSPDSPPDADDTFVASAWTSGYGTHTDLPLDLTIAGFMVPASPALTIPTMLFPKKIEFLKITEAGDLEAEGTRVCRATACDVLYSAQESTRIWIDRKTHLIRRVAEYYDDGNSDSANVTEYDPSIDTEIEASKLVFVPPTATHTKSLR